MNFTGEYRSIGDIDITEIKQLINNLSEEHWLDNETRQNRYEVHQDTETIALVWDEDFRHSKPTKQPALEMFSSAIRPALTKIADYYESSEKWRKYFEVKAHGYFVRANFVKLKAGGKISAHQDNNFSLAHSHRIHIPIITNDEVTFDIGEMTMNLLEGEIVEINNRKMHSVTNNSKFDRVHLILDWVVPGEKCCCGEKLRPTVPCDPVVCLKSDRLI